MVCCFPYFKTVHQTHAFHLWCMCAYESLVWIQCNVWYCQRNSQADFLKIKEDVLLIKFGGDFRVPNTTYLIVHFNFSSLSPFMIIGVPSVLQSRDETKSFYTNFSRPLKAALSYMKSFLASSFNLDSRPNIKCGKCQEKLQKHLNTIDFFVAFKVKHAIQNSLITWE